MPFLNEPPGAKLSTTAITMYGQSVRALRNLTRGSMNKEPEGRTRSPLRLVPPPGGSDEGERK